MKQNKRIAFTLLEMMIVLVVLGVIASALIIKVKSTVGKASDVTRIKDISTLSLALNLYYLDTGRYPPHTPNPSAGLSGAWLTGVNCGWSGCGWETSLDTGWMTTLVGKYITSVPRDPKNKYNNAFPWDTLANHDVYMYVYANYASGYIWGDLTSCAVPTYALVGVTNFEQTAPGMRPACPGYDRSTLVDYGFVLHKGNTYAEYTNYPIGQGTGGGVWTGGTWGTWWAVVPPLALQCDSTASSYTVWSSISCYCPAANINIAGNNDHVWGTNEYTHNSETCNAAVHAGILSVAGGNMTILITPWRSNYIGSLQNGVQSNSRNSSPRSFRLYYYTGP